MDHDVTGTRARLDLLKRRRVCKTTKLSFVNQNLWLLTHLGAHKMSLNPTRLCPSAPDVPRTSPCLSCSCFHDANPVRRRVRSKTPPGDAVALETEEEDEEREKASPSKAQRRVRSKTPPTRDGGEFNGLKFTNLRLVQKAKEKLCRRAKTFV